MTIAVGIKCAIAGLYLYVTILLYVRELFDQRRQKRQGQEETRRRRKLWESAKEERAKQTGKAKEHGQIIEARNRRANVAGKTLSPVLPKARPARPGRA